MKQVNFKERINKINRKTKIRKILRSGKNGEQNTRK